MRSLILVALSLAWMLACDPPEDGYPPSCQAIVDACHDVEELSEMAAECHDATHHEGTDAACAPVEEECVTHCRSLGADGGR